MFYFKPNTARRIWRAVMGGGSLYVGFGYAFGPPAWYQTPSLELVRQFYVPVPVWGIVMMIAGVLIFTPWRAYGHWIAMIMWSFWFACIAAVAFSSFFVWLLELFGHTFHLGLPVISGWGAPIYVLVWTMVHVHMVLGPQSDKVYIVRDDNCEEGPG